MEEMASMSPPPAHSVSPKGDDEVVSQKTFPNWGSFQRSSGWRPRMILQSSDTWGKKSPRGLVTGPEFPSDLSRIPFWRSTRLRGPANGILHKEGTCLFHR